MLTMRTETLRRLTEGTRGRNPTRLEAGDGWLRALPRERDRFVQAEVEGTLGLIEGRNVDFAALRRFLLSVNAETTQLEIADGRLTAKTDGSSLTIPLRSPSDICDKGTIPEFKAETTLPVEVLAQAATLLPYVSTDETRPTLCNVSFERDGDDLLCVATDTHKCGVLRFGGLIAGMGGWKNVLVPADALRMVGKLFKGEEPPLRYGDCTTWHRLCGESGFSYGWRACIGQFPDWRKVIPEDSGETTVTLPTTEALAALRTALAADDYNRVTISAEGAAPTDTTTFTCDGLDTKAVAECPDVSWVGSQESIDLNGVYLGQIIRAHRALGAREVRLELRGRLSVVTIEGPEPPKAPATAFRSVVMPMQK